MLRAVATINLSLGGVPVHHSRFSLTADMPRSYSFVFRETSGYFVSGEIGQVYRGMMVAIAPAEWAIFRDMSFEDYVAFLKRLARNVDFARYPKAHRGPKKAKPKRRHDPEHPHVSVAKILLARKLKDLG